jgi:hypothetical protein
MATTWTTCETFQLSGVKVKRVGDAVRESDVESEMVTSSIGREFNVIP